MSKPNKKYRTILITPEEFYVSVPQSLVPKKALKGDFDFYYINDLKLYFIYNKTLSQHYVFK